jgi:pimeloyl-ACP methyl ester carboxylesterase
MRPSLHISSSGRGRPTIVLVHGYGTHGAFWRKWIPALSRDHQVHAVDLMGFGSAPAPWSGDYSPSAQAERLAGFLREVGADGPIVLVGHSLGAGIALLAAVTLAEESGASPIVGLVIVSGAAYPQRLPTYMSLARMRAVGDLFLLAPPPRFAIRRGIRGIVHDPASITNEQVDAYRSPLRSMRRRWAALRAARQIDMKKALGLAALLPILEVPSLLLWGEEDRVVTLDTGRRLSRDLARSTLVTLPGVGHLPPEEAPEASLAPVLDFLSSLPGSHGEDALLRS